MKYTITVSIATTAMRREMIKKGPGDRSKLRRTGNCISLECKCKEVHDVSSD